ncbi:hypothetical protein phytr_12020 [Candidatus Phycorickettsia trachydisci]|uniref:Uncharacterized protein n=1 Tax=Candidatus Phycorickettsia trachydisci TaxID=2115978 RepID=A0A2P1PA35_9RICK|nr:hypothetical protein [Candidatus Phycorickettsia trachydisci]AVP88127.1 hypothetical protein phytr_12020 [Candidatus Phycorickettsia trachydisci]
MNIIFNNHKESKVQNHVSTFKLNSLEQMFPPELDYWNINSNTNSAEEFIDTVKRKLDSLNDRVNVLKDQLESLKGFTEKSRQFDDSIGVTNILYGNGGKNLFLVQNGRGFSNWQHASMEDSADLHAKILDTRLAAALREVQKQEKVVQELQNFLKDKRSVDNSQIKYYIMEGSADYITDSFNSFNINSSANSSNPSNMNSIFCPNKQSIELMGEEWMDG